MYDALEKKNFVIRKYIHYNHIKNEQFLNVEHSLHTIKVVSLMCRHSRLEISQQNWCAVLYWIITWLKIRVADQDPFWPRSRSTGPPHPLDRTGPDRWTGISCTAVFTNMLIYYRVIYSRILGGCFNHGIAQTDTNFNFVYLRNSSLW